MGNKMRKDATFKGDRTSWLQGVKEQEKKGESARALSCTSTHALSPLFLSTPRGIVALLRRSTMRLHCRYNRNIDRLDVFLRGVSYTG